MGGYTGSNLGQSGFGTGGYGNAGFTPLKTLPWSYYLGLISPQYQSSPKFMAMRVAMPMYMNPRPSRSMAAQ